ncbi:MAG: type I-C CRISPR-associated protein Cas7/Csd2 [Chloroflexota bacterium]|nr:type I-C CRISPR-associated protein Cas7/Csd2 [Chloroflexota bacterium]
MTTTVSSSVVNDVERRHDFVLLFDVTDGNPNGDPDAGNLPRVDPETMQGLVTDVCLKRKVRDWVLAAQGGKPGLDIFVQHRIYLYDQQSRPYKEKGWSSKDDKKAGDARKRMCELFYDVRMFGAVMSTTEYNCGQVRGPVQLTFARSIDLITPLDISITRVALTKPGDVAQRQEEGDEAPTFGTMGRKAIVPYALYVGHGFFSPSFAQGTPQSTGVTPDDLCLFWQALQEMWELDRSASRGLMACRGLYVFNHESKLGNAPAHTLFARITAQKKVETPRRFEDYEVTVNGDNLPQGVTLTTLVG